MIKQTEPLVLVDVSNLAHRNWHALRRTGIAKPAVYGVLRDLFTLAGRIASQRFVFCFDGTNLARKDDYPAYKAGREPADPALKEQIDLLRVKVLHALGCRNILWNDKAEADDLIALCCSSTVEKLVIVSDDSDLYQLLWEGEIRMFLPGKKTWMTEQSLFEKYGVLPKEWATYKAMVGCLTDNIPGLEKVGPIAASGYLRGSLPKSYVAYKRIEEGTDEIESGLMLTRLPHRSLRKLPIVIQDDEITPQRWRKVCLELGYDSIADRWRG